MSHISPLHELAYTYNIELDRIEKISLVCISPCYTKKLTTRMLANVEEVSEQDLASMVEVQIYMDRLGLDGKAGADVVFQRRGGGGGVAQGPAVSHQCSDGTHCLKGGSNRGAARTSHAEI